MNSRYASYQDTIVIAPQFYVCQTDSDDYCDDADTTGLDDDLSLQLDEGIVRAVWMTADEIRACPERHRSPLVLECLESYLAGQRYPLELLTVHESVFTAPSHHRAA